MSQQEVAKRMIDKLPEDKLVFIINILGNLGEMSGVHVYPEYEPNAETIAAMEEVQKMIDDGSHTFSGSTEDFFAELLEE